MKKMRDLADNDIYSAAYNQKVRELIKDCMQKNDNTPIDQPSLIPILIEASKSLKILICEMISWSIRDSIHRLPLPTRISAHGLSLLWKHLPDAS